jgi:hypothetical protein
MDKISHGTQTQTNDIAHMSAGDDMRVLNVLVENVRGLMPVSGSAVELGLPDPELLDELGAELV